LPVVGERPQMGTGIMQDDYTLNTGLGERVSDPEWS